MNYTKLYDCIISNSKNRKLTGYVEKHHILPKSLSGSDDESNIAVLTSREHFICHYLLTKMYEKGSFEWYKMNHAFMIMKSESKTQCRYVNSRLYESKRNNFSKVMNELQTGENNSQWGSRWIFNVELRENKKVSKDFDLPEGWCEGRTLVWDKPTKVKICNKCGEIVCERPDVCNKRQMINTLITYFGFDKSVIGSNLIYKEYDRIKEMLYTEYHISKLSIEDLKIKYGVTSNERMRYIFKSLGIDRRSLSDAVSNYSNKSD